MEATEYNIGDRVILAHPTTSYGRRVGQGRRGIIIDKPTGNSAHVDWEDFIGHDKGGICTGHCYSVELSTIELDIITESNCPYRAEHHVLPVENCPFCGARIR